MLRNSSLDTKHVSKLYTHARKSVFLMISLCHILQTPPVSDLIISPPCLCFTFPLHRTDLVNTHFPLFFCLHRYKLVELAFYLTMGFFPASVVTSMVIYICIDISTITFSLSLKPSHHVFISADKPNMRQLQGGAVSSVSYFLFRVFDKSSQKTNDAFKVFFVI